MNKYNLILITLAIVIFTSCGSHHQPPPIGVSKVSTIKGFHDRDGVITWTWAVYNIETINDKPAASFSHRSVIKLNSGENNIIVGVLFSRGFGVGPYIARGEIKMNFIAGRNYIAKGRVEGVNMLLWIEDVEDPRIKSEITKTPYHNHAAATYTPIYIPVN